MGASPPAAAFWPRWAGCWRLPARGRARAWRRAAIGPASLADTRRDDAHEPFWGQHQAGIVTRAQKHTYFAVFDVVAKNKAEVADLLKRWTDAAAQLTAGQTLGELKDNASGPAAIPPMR